MKLTKHSNRRIFRLYRHNSKIDIESEKPDNVYNSSYFAVIHKQVTEFLRITDRFAVFFTNNYISVNCSYQDTCCIPLKASVNCPPQVAVSSSFSKKRTHHTGKPENDVSNFYQWLNFKVHSLNAENGLFHCLFNSNCASNGHTNHRVVTCADQTHHFYMKSAFGGFPRVKKQAKTSF